MKSLTILSSKLLAACVFSLIIQAVIFGPVMAADQTGVSQQDFDRFLEWFPGEYDNNEQVWQQGEDGVPDEEKLEHIHHIFLPVSAPEIGEHTFFIRQYMDGDYENVYRQRLYNLVQDKESGAIRLQIFSFNDEAKYRNTDQEPALIANITPEELRNMPGCDVYWRYQGDHYIGEMVDKACFFHSERMDKDIYITDTLTLTDSEIWINDQAFDAEGSRIFGSEIPHKNRKVRYFKGWAVIKKNHFDEAAPDDEYFVVSGFRIHNEGQVIPLVTREGMETGYSIELAQLTYQESKTPILKLALRDKEDYAFTYIWANTEAEKLGINLRWIQVGLSAEK